MNQQPPKLCDSYRAQGYWTDRLLTDFLESAVERSPNKIAVVDERFDPISYANLAKEISRLAAALQAHGIGRGDKFIIALPNWQHVTIFMLALGYLGAVSVHMPIAGREHEFGGVLKVSNAKGIVVAGEFRGFSFVEMIDGIVDDFPSLTTRITVGSNQDDPGWTGYDRLLAEAPSDAPQAGEPVTPSDLMFLLFTSGSSGEPKGVMHSSNTLTAMNAGVAPIYDLGPDDVIFTAAPLGFSGGLVHGVRLALFLGSTVVLLESWDADRALELMAREKAAYCILTPTLLRDLLDIALGRLEGGIGAMAVTVGQTVEDFLLPAAATGADLAHFVQAILDDPITAALNLVLGQRNQIDCVVEGGLGVAESVFATGVRHLEEKIAAGNG